MKKIISEKNSVILDNGTFEEYKEDYIKNALNIDLYSVNFENDLNILINKNLYYLLQVRR